jgi:hypothetical protein
MKNSNKKEIILELVYDIPSLIRMQELSLIELKKSVRDQRVIDFQEDVLRVLKAVSKMDMVKLEYNEIEMRKYEEY